MTELSRDTGSFRDPSGYVHTDGKTIVRTINDVYSEEWNTFIDSGLAKSLINKGLLIPWEEIEPMPGSWKSIRSEKLQFVSYPYEWSFGQLKDAALLTLDLQYEALKHGMVLKDASAFNVQFIGSKPIFIDHLSFERHKKDRPWNAYRQFCMHFLAPLAVSHYLGGQWGRATQLWLEGFPLDLASSLLPLQSRFSPSMQIHIHMHARMQKKYSDSRAHVDDIKKLSVKSDTTLKLCASLQYAIEKLSPKSAKTEWDNYYSDTNYTDIASQAKADIVRSLAEQNPGRLALDAGANTGKYSRLLSDHFLQVLASDIDFMAVEHHYSFLKKSENNNITPLVLDLTNPTPALGFGHEERQHFAARCQVDFLMGLALIHHLTLGSGVPLEKVAEYFHRLITPGGNLLLEFVPREDSQVQRLMAARDIIFENYHLEGCLEAFRQRFELKERIPVADSCRTLLFFTAKA